MGNITDGKDKKEMGFFDHIEALRWHIMRSAIAVVAGALIAFTQKKFIFDYLLFGPTNAQFPTNRFFCWLENNYTFFQGLCIKDAKFTFINTDITGQFMLHIQMALYVGAIGAFPYVFWEIWRFIKPALHEREIRNTRGIVFITSMLFTIGCLFGYFIIAPFSINFLVQYQATSIVLNMIDINSYIGLLITMTIPTGILFELPMLVYLLTKLGILTPEFMRKGRRISYVAILVVVAIITPQGDVTSLLLISAPIFLLYELSIGVSNRVYKQLVKEEAY
ncbi:MAG: twin-arginine translocase subunit TatC [Chitinophagales bacterium]|nr:twin-arginine translocase subunit TatC [Chitinophagales bacterium]HMV14508.1 twin-arginine translocase subunit TatC [Chitinophagales bacterium]HMW11653.1 twin-arginine translocase subunit TatC [Chitinophagales bacterium]HMX59203.1 twin-arginine translocase subunit TatC [Chitinophagales bacterium]HMY23600.1 twin-arginine translocase subunit TatC [Chitinophagales bacterium]